MKNLFLAPKNIFEKEIFVKLCLHNECNTKKECLLFENDALFDYTH
jgi:hypothetical protein